MRLEQYTVAEEMAFEQEESDWNEWRETICDPILLAFDDSVLYPLFLLWRSEKLQAITDNYVDWYGK